MHTHTWKSYVLLMMVVGLLPSTASAASIYFETSRNTISVGDTVILTAKIDAEDTTINSVEGDVVLDQSSSTVVVNDFSLAKSVFSLWPRTPSLSADGNTISFVGGVPGGFDLNNAVLFSVIVEAQKEGALTVSPKNIAIYANDGKGTRVAVNPKSLTITVSPKNEAIAPTNEWESLVGADKTNPEPFTIVIGKDASLFEGRRFAFFTAVDNQSGISYYEVSEDGGPAIRSGSMYVLQNQDEQVTPLLTVTAYDKAGNKTVSVYTEPSTRIFGVSLPMIIGGVILIIIALLFILKKRKNNLNAQKN